MTAVKFFKDGDRFVLVFEGLENSPSTENMIKNIVSTVTAANIKAEPEAVAKPVPVKEEKPPEIKFEGGFFDGKTKREALDYLKKRFVNTNADEYAGKLTDGQKTKFLAQMKGMIPKGETDVSKIIKAWQQA